MLESMHDMLATLHQEMRPLSEGMIGPARWIGGIGAYTYLFLRLIKHLAKAEPIDFFPLFKPFAVALAITFYPFVLSMLELMCSPAVMITEAMVEGQHNHIEALQEKKEKAMARKEENQLYEDEVAFKEELDSYGITEIGAKMGLYLSRASYSMRKYFRLFIKELLELLYYTAALMINLARTIFLVVLEITGPIPLALSILPGFANSFISWVGRYINIFMWLPVTNIYGSIIGKIQVFMLEQDIARMEAGTESFVLEDLGSMMFLLLAIGGYCMVPMATAWMVSASGVGSALSTVGGMAKKALKEGKKAVSGDKQKSKSNNNQVVQGADPQIPAPSVPGVPQVSSGTDTSSSSSSASSSSSKGNTESTNADATTSEASTPNANSDEIESGAGNENENKDSENTSADTDTTATTNSSTASKDSENAQSASNLPSSASEATKPQGQGQSQDSNPSGQWKYFNKYDGGNNNAE